MYSRYFNGFPEYPRSEWDYIIKYRYGRGLTFTGIARCNVGERETIGERIHRILTSPGGPVEIMSISTEHKDLAKLMMAGIGKGHPRNYSDRDTDYDILMTKDRFR